MAEYNEVIKQFKRMCKYYNGQKCGGCPLYCKGHGCNISHCRMLAFDDKKFQNVVMTWAETHKEPMYPTWAEWLNGNGMLLNARMYGSDKDWMLGINAFQPIPADIAEKLGLEPKED